MRKQPPNPGVGLEHAEQARVYFIAAKVCRKGDAYDRALGLKFYNLALSQAGEQEAEARQEGQNNDGGGVISQPAARAF